MIETENMSTLRLRVKDIRYSIGRKDSTKERRNEELVNYNCLLLNHFKVLQI